jgi:hypothetical protein
LVQIDAAHVEDADQDKGPGQLADRIVETNNLLVEGTGVASGLAADDNQEWSASLLRDEPGKLVIGVPTRKEKGEGEQQQVRHALESLQIARSARV